MMIALAYCQRDHEAALNLLKWIRELSGAKGHDLLLCRDGRITPDISEPIEREASAAFRSVHNIVAPAPIDGWPEGANYMWRMCSSTMTYNKQVDHFLWLEPDAVPMTPGWLDALEKEYLNAGKPFMGDRVEVGDIPVHMSGVAIYPNPIYQYAGEAARAHDIAWDMAAKDQIVPLAHFTTLIEHAWKHPTFAADDEINSQIAKETVLFHSSKDGSLIKLLRGRNSSNQKAPSPPIGPITHGAPSPTSSQGQAEIADFTSSTAAKIWMEKPVAESPPAGDGMVTDIFIRTYEADFKWLRYCLESIAKFCTGFRKVFIASPDQLVISGEIPVNMPTEWKQITEECDDHYLSQQITKLYADVLLDYQPDYILHLDSDTIFTRPCKPENFFAGDKPIWYYTPYANIEVPWQPITEKFMQDKVENEFMRRFPIIVPKWLYPRVREFCYKKSGGYVISEYIKNQPLRSFSEFNALGAYAFKFHYNMFHWVNTLEVEMPPPFAKQYWSHCGFTEEEKEIQQILKGGDASCALIAADSIQQDTTATRTSNAAPTVQPAGAAGCVNCGQPIPDHCKHHVIPCCPGKCYYDHIIALKEFASLSRGNRTKVGIALHKYGLGSRKK